MNETQNNIEKKVNNSEILDNLGKEPDKIDRIEAIRIEKQKDNADWQKKYDKAVNKNIDLGDKVEELTEEVNQTKLEKKALEKALWRERSRKDITREQELSEAQRLGNQALEIIKQRCRQGRYGGRPCQECQIGVR